MSETEKPIEESAGADKTVREERVITDDGEFVQHEETVSPVRRRIHPGLIAALILAVVVIFLLGWYMLSSGSGGGQPVPAPRSSVSDMPAETITAQTLTLSPEQVANAGLTFATVGEQLSTESSEASSTGTIEANAYRQTPAVTLVGGVVRRVSVELGEYVRAGQTIAVVFSDEFAQAQSRYIALRTEAENARRNYERTQRLVEINQPGQTELQQATKQRKAAEAAVFEMRNRYSRTSRLVLIGAASREELEQDTTKLRAAEAELEEARGRESRATSLLPISAEVRSASEEALNKLRTAESDLAATRQRLILLGMPASRVNGLGSPSQVTSELAVPAPVTGTITARSVNGGEVVEANKELAQITDLTTVWVIAQVYERDIGRMRVGGGASITSDAFPNRIFRGHITYIDPQIDAGTRTGRVRVEVENPGGALKLGMYVRVAFGSLGMAERTVPIVPADAVQEVNGQQVVFAATNDPNVFEMRPVRLGPASEGRYQILEGINVGDRVVVSGSFALRAEWLKLNQGNSHQH
jgi:cobalt-zinc-cadmium efflux system membrane fusion protein